MAVEMQSHRMPAPLLIRGTPQHKRPHSTKHQPASASARRHPMFHLLPVHIATQPSAVQGIKHSQAIQTDLYCAAWDSFQQPFRHLAGHEQCLRFQHAHQ
jgi:hypothetical protein